MVNVNIFNKETKEFVHYYLLALWVLIGYYVGTLLDVTTYAFEQSLFWQTVILTLFYGTWLLIGDKILHKYWIGEK